MRALAIFGTSGHAREARDVAVALGFEVTFIARDGDDLGTLDVDGPVLAEAHVDRLEHAGFAIGIGDNRIRETVASHFAARLRFINLIHPEATLGPDLHGRLATANGVIVAAGARISNRVTLGDFCFIGANAVVSHDSSVGSFAMVAPSATVLGNVSIGSRAWVGAGATVVQGTPDVARRIGEDAIVGAGAVVTSDCESGGVYVGVPSRRIR